MIARSMARVHGPTHVKAYHTNTPLPMPPSAEQHPAVHAEMLATPLTAAEQAGLARATAFQGHGDAYMKIMSTRPLTLGYSLRDSPVGLLAWIYEKMHAWSDNYPWTDEEILTWVSVYYFSTAGGHASSRVYHAMEYSDPPAFQKQAEYVADVPLGIARFENDLVLLPKVWNKTLGPIAFEGEHAKGGHFAAWENPEAIVGDLRSMFAEHGPLGDVVRSMRGAQ